MNGLRKMMDFMLEKFGKGPFAPVVEALDFFLFSPDKVPGSPPYIRDGVDLKRFMSWAIVGLFPAFFGSIYFFGPRVILVVLVSYIAGAIVEVIFSILRKEPIAEGLLVTGLIFPLTLPVGIPLWMVALGAIFGVFFGKEVFGGTGHNIMNPALVGRAFLFLSFPKALSTGWVIPGQGALGAGLSADAATGATPLLAVKLGQSVGASVTETIQSVLGSDWVQLLWTKGPDAFGTTSAILVIFGGLIVIFTKVANWRIPVSIFGTVIGLGWVLHLLAPDTFMPPHYQILAGGLLYGAFFMATDPVSGPTYNNARWVYGLGIGILILVIRGLSGYPEGVMFSILIMNLVTPLLDHGSRTLHSRRFHHG